MNDTYVSLHTHTEYSLLDGACKIPELVDLAVEYGMEALAISDHGCMFGAIPFYNKCLNSGIKPIIGQECYVSVGDMTERKALRQGPAAGHHLLLLAKDRVGYKNLIKISSAGYLEGFYYKPRVDKEFLARHSEGLIACTACLKGEVPYKLLRDDHDGARKALNELIDIYGKDNLFIEIMDHGLEEEKKVLPMLAGLSAESGIPMVATTDAHYLRREDSDFHDLLLCLQTGKLRSDENRMRFSSDQMYFKSPNEMKTLFADYPQAVENTIEVAARCNLELDLDKLLLPKFPIPEGFEGVYDYIKDQTYEGLKDLYGELSEEVTQRAEYELSVVRKMGYSGYFAIVADFTKAARDHGVRVGPGRGSGASSIVAYALGITTVDPLRYGLLFERFLNPERVSMPDFDIDFEDTGRDKVIDYVKEKYGADSVAQIITFNFMKARGAIKDVGRVLDMPFDFVDKISKLVPMAPGMNLTEALRQIPDLKKRYDEESDVKKLIDYALKLEGLPRHVGKHAAGVVITPGTITDYVPLYCNNNDEITTQYDWKSVETAGLVKMDFLGLKTLSIISTTEKMIERTRQEKVDTEKLQLDDADTFELMSHGDTLGVFQFESEGMVRCLRKLHPDRIEDMIAMNALYRPGPMKFIDDYIARKHGKQKVEYPHDCLKDILEETYGIIVYQEQVMQLAQEMSGFSLGQADILRRAMGKKKLEAMLSMKKDFLEGAKSRGIDRKIAETVFDMLEEFSRYGFNKSHSTAYSILAYRTAYLKAHYRTEFAAANMTNEMNNTDKLAVWLEDCSNHDIEVFPPDINRSLPDFEVFEGKILYGLAAVKNVGHTAAEAIVEARQEGEFENLYDFCQRVDLHHVNRRALESLVYSGAFDSIGQNRATIAGAIAEALAWASKASNEVVAAAGDLFQEDTSLKKFPEPTYVEPWPRQILLNHEKESLGLYFSGHPLNRFADIIEALADRNSKTIQTLGNNARVALAGALSTLTKATTKKKKPMAYGTAEDTEGSVSVVFFPDTFSQVHGFLEEDNFYLFVGKYKIDDRGDKIVVEDVYPLETAREKLISQVHVRLESDFAEEELNEIKELIRKYPGNKTLHMHIVGKNHTYRAIAPEYENSADKELIKKLREELGKDNVWIKS